MWVGTITAVVIGVINVHVPRMLKNRAYLKDFVAYHVIRNSVATYFIS